MSPFYSRCWSGALGPRAHCEMAAAARACSIPDSAGKLLSSTHDPKEPRTKVTSADENCRLAPARHNTLLPHRRCKHTTLVHTLAAASRTGKPPVAILSAQAQVVADLDLFLKSPRRITSQHQLTLLQ